MDFYQSRYILIFFLVHFTFVFPQSSVHNNVSVIDSLLEESLWIDRDIYDATHFLMVPLHYGFKNSKEITKFRIFFDSFLKNIKVYYKNTNSLNRLQFLFLISQYLKLYFKFSKDQNSRLEIELFNFLINEINYYWTIADVTSWKDNGVTRFTFTGIRDRIDWKLNSAELDNSYYNKAIIDDEKFLFAIAADLRFLIRNTKFESNLMIDKNLGEIEGVTIKVFRERVTDDKQGFVFQQGSWFRHRDYRFAGCETLECVKIGDNKLKNISEDTSHSLRMPLLLDSFKDGASSFKDKVFFKKLKTRLANQLLDKVIKQMQDSKCFYITNYLDGTNGYYRYNYITHRSQGYGPFELAETFKLGWWVFLEDKRITKLYKQVNENLKNHEPCEYRFKDKTSRKRNPIIKNRFENNLYLEITQMASKLKFN